MGTTIEQAWQRGDATVTIEKPTGESSDEEEGRSSTAKYLIDFNYMKEIVQESVEEIWAWDD
eukprot:gene10629-3853_t